MVLVLVLVLVVLLAAAAAAAAAADYAAEDDEDDDSVVLMSGPGALNPPLLRPYSRGPHHPYCFHDHPQRAPAIILLILDSQRSDYCQFPHTVPVLIAAVVVIFLLLIIITINISIMTIVVILPLLVFRFRTTILGCLRYSSACLI